MACQHDFYDCNRTLPRNNRRHTGFDSGPFIQSPHGVACRGVPPLVKPGVLPRPLADQPQTLEANLHVYMEDTGRRSAQHSGEDEESGACLP